MANKFVKIGNIQGKPITEIIKRVGKPNSISTAGNGMLYQWMRTSIFFGSYHYAISVDTNGNAIGYSHQFTK